MVFYLWIDVTICNLACISMSLSAVEASHSPGGGGSGLGHKELRFNNTP